MKPLFVLAFAVLAVAAHADQYAFPPMHYPAVPVYEVVTICEMPSYDSVPSTLGKPVVPLMPLKRLDESNLSGALNLPERYTVSKPAENTITLPPPLDDRIGPRLPPQEPPLEPRSETIRGQARTMDVVSEILDSSLPFAKGAVADGIVDPKLMESPATDWDSESIRGSSPQEKPKQTGTPAEPTDPVGYGVLLFATAITAFMLICMAFVAYDYQQRWVQSLTVQNDRYIGGGTFDMEMENVYSGSVSLSEGFGLTHRSI